MIPLAPVKDMSPAVDIVERASTIPTYSGRFPPGIETRQKENLVELGLL
jgi:hypothetical protein